MSLTKGLWFGVSLETIISRPGEKEVPSLVKKLTWALASPSNVGVEGLFEKKAKSNNVQQKKYSIDTGEEFGFEKEDAHTLAALLKLYLRELPEPLLTFGLYAPLLSSTEIIDPTEREARIVALVETLPPLNFDLFHFMLNFFAAVLQHAAYNGVTTSKLVEAFYPVFIRPKVETVETMQEFPDVLSLLKQVLDIYIKGSVLGSAIGSVVKKDESTSPTSTSPSASPSTPSASATPSSASPQAKQRASVAGLPGRNMPRSVTMILSDTTQLQQTQQPRLSMIATSNNANKHSVDQVKRAVQEAIKQLHTTLDELSEKAEGCQRTEDLVDIARVVQVARKALLDK